MSDTITSTKLEEGGEIFWNSRCCLSAWVSAFFSPAHESEMRGSLVFLSIVKYLSVLFKFSHSIEDWTTLSWNFVVVIVDFLKYFLERSVDHIIHRDYIVNRSLFISCSLSTSSASLLVMKKSRGKVNAGNKMLL